MEVIGWDIGGVNTKVALVRNGRLEHVTSQPFEIQRAPEHLPALLRTLAQRAGHLDSAVHAVTMTAELSQMFVTKRDGVHRVIDAVETAFPHDPIFVYGVDGCFLLPDAARQRVLQVAAANWAATASIVAHEFDRGLLIDVGTTTSDLIPFADGRHRAHGTTDPERLASGELVYTGVVRTPIEAILDRVPFASGTAGVSAEGFALAGDAHVWIGSLAPADYTVDPPDGRAVTRDSAALRLARVVCADREMIDDDGISRIADAVVGAQRDRLVAAIDRIRARNAWITRAVVTGLGAFLAEEAARAAGLAVVHLSDAFGVDAARSTPAAAVALLLARRPLPGEVAR